MLFKIVTVLLVSLTLTAAQSRPNLACVSEGSTNRNCRLEHIYLPREFADYTISAPSPISVENVQIWFSQLAVINNNFCTTFSSLNAFYADGQGIEVLTANAFSGCTSLQQIDLDNNFIQVLPENVFRNAISLQNLAISNNKLQAVPTNLFELTSNLRSFHASNNQITTFSVAAFRNTNALTDLYLDSNDITDLHEAQLLQYLTALKFVKFNDNLLPCSSVYEVLRTFERNNVHVYSFVSTPKTRVYKMSSVNSFICVEDRGIDILQVTSLNSTDIQ